MCNDFELRDLPDRNCATYEVMLSEKVVGDLITNSPPILNDMEPFFDEEASEKLGRQLIVGPVLTTSHLTHDVSEFSCDSTDLHDVPDRVQVSLPSSVNDVPAFPADSSDQSYIFVSRDMCFRNAIANINHCNRNYGSYVEYCRQIYLSSIYSTHAEFTTKNFSDDLIPASMAGVGDSSSTCPCPVTLSYVAPNLPVPFPTVSQHVLWLSPVVALCSNLKID